MTFLVALPVTISLVHQLAAINGSPLLKYFFKHIDSLFFSFSIFAI